MRAAIASLLLVFFVAPAAAAPTKNVHQIDWFVHVDLIDVGMGLTLAFYTQLLEDRMAEADIQIQGHQGPIDVGCCVELDPVSVSTFGTTGDGLDVITTNAELSAVFALGAGAYLVQSVHFCAGLMSTGIRGCAETPGDGLVVGFESEDTDALAKVSAHERGHNSGLNHVFGNPCELMSGSNGGGCLSISECGFFNAGADIASGTCECLDDTLGSPPVAFETACTDPSGNGVCSGGVCGDSMGIAGARLIAAAGAGNSTGETTDDAIVQTGGANDWDSLGAIPVEVSGLAYDEANDVLYGIEVLAGDDALITIDPVTGAKTGTIGTLTGKEEVIALAFDPQGSGDRLFAVEVDDDFFGTTCMDINPLLTPPCISELFEIDPSNANVTVLGELNSMIITDGVTGLAWDDTNGVLYAANPAGLETVTLASCNTFTCSSVAVDNISRVGPALAWDPVSGRLIREGDLLGRTEVDVIDPATGTRESKRGVDPFTAGGLAVVPAPEPAAALGLAAGLALLFALGRRRR